MGSFFVLWASQVASWIGSGMVGFAIGVWTFQRTGSATQFALITFFGMLPGILAGPFLGVLVDRWDRRLCLAVGDSVSALTTVVLILLLWPEPRLEVWHIYPLTALNSLFSALQRPAFSASIPLLVGKEQLGRAAGMVQLGSGAPMVLAPLMAGGMVAAFGLKSVLMVDLLAASVALTLLIFVHIPRPEADRRKSASSGSRWLSEAAEGWRYLLGHRGLLALALTFAGSNFAFGMIHVLVAPMVLSFAGADTLGFVLSVMSLGFVAGGALVTWTGGPSRRAGILRVLLALQAACILALSLRPWAFLVAVALFFFMFMTPIVSSSSEVIWQRTVPAELMGRVFATRRFVALSMVPFAQLLAGPLAERVFEPFLIASSRWSGVARELVGSGSGRGIALLFVCLAAFLWLVAGVGAGNRQLLALDLEESEAPAVPAVEGGPELQEIVPSEVGVDET